MGLYPHRARIRAHALDLHEMPLAQLERVLFMLDRHVVDALDIPLDRV